MATDDGRSLGEVAEGDRPDDALGLGDDVVVHHHRVGRGALADALELAAGVAARAAEVALHDHPELVPQARPGRREVGAVGDLVLALVHHEDRVEVGLELLGVAELAQQLGAHVGEHRGDADVDGAVLGAIGRDLRGPLGALDRRTVVAGDDVVPVPPAVDERLERQGEGERAGVPLDGRGVHALRVPACHRLVDRHHRAGAGHRHGELDVRHDGVPAPVGRRERVEVGAEGEQLGRLEPERGARADLVGVQLATGGGRLADRGVVEVLGRLVAADRVAVGVELGLLEVDVEREDVGVAVEGQDLPLEQTRGGRGDGAHASMPPLVSSAPSVKCGLSLLSYIDSAAPIAMCMSRYL